MLAFNMSFCLIGMLVVWNNWIFMESDGFSPSRRPSFLQFYWLAVVNVFRMMTLGKSYSFSEYYPHLFPVTNNHRQRWETGE